MKKTLLIMFLLLLVLSAFLYFAGDRLGLSKENVLTIFGYYFVLNGTILVFTQIRITLKFNQRKASLDLIFGSAMTTLLSFEDQLKTLLNRASLTFVPTEKATEWLATLEAEQRLQGETAIIFILNFYERMSLGVLKEGFDEDICYDDRGFILTNFYGWTNSYIADLRSKHNEPRLFANVEYLALKWTERIQQDRNELVRHQTRSRQPAVIRNRRIN
ncbi:MAG TPA: DUF4760 domain-containing protein [Pyrinomonadaceae bacterium]|jgi:hypothetical protein